MLFETVKLALQAIWRNAMRSFLTVLGVVIGVGAVIAMVTIGHGTTAKVTADLARLGANVLVVQPGQFGPGRASSDAKAFNSRDVDALKNQLSGVRAVAPVARKTVTIIHGAENRLTPAAGVDNDYFIAQAWPLQAGREFLDSEVRGGRTVCVIGATVRQKLFGNSEFLDRTIRVNRAPCVVVGLLEAKGQTSFGTDQDDVVLMPLRAFQRRIAGNADITTISVSADDGVDTAKVQADLERLLRERRHIARGAQDDFSSETSNRSPKRRPRPRPS